MHSLPNKFPADTSPLLDTVELMEFGDFACPRCRRNRDLFHTVLTAFEGQISYTYRHFPNDQSEMSRLAALAAEAARRQGNFWPMAQALFTQPTITRTTVSIVAIYLGMNYSHFLDDLGDEHLWQRIEADRREGYRLGVTTTPTLFIGGQQFHGKLTQSRLIPIIRSHLNRCTQPVLSKVDPANGTVYWGLGDWG